MLSRRIALLTVFLVSTAISGEELQQHQGAELLVPLKTQLKTALQHGLQGGPAHAISVCRDQAPAIAESLSSDGVRMGRASHRLRNPDNAPPSWVDDALQIYLDDESKWKPQSFKLEDGLQGYVEPIVIQPLCLACHGESIAEDVASEIRDTYPNDRATGFKLGELRGVYWVEFESSTESSKNEPGE